MKINLVKLTGLLIVILNLVLFCYFSLTQNYSFPLVVFHFLSLVIFWLWIINLRKIFRYFKKNPWDLGLIVILFLVSFTVRIYKLEVITPGMFGDEITVGVMSEKLWKLSEYTPFLEDNYGHSTPLLYLTGWVINTFGRSITAIRIVSVLFGALGVVVFYLFLRFFFQKPIAIATSLMMVFSYPYVIVSRFGYEMTAAIFFEILTLIFLWLANKTKNYRFYIGIGLAIGGGLLTYLAFRTIALVFLIISLFLLKQLPSLKDKFINMALLLIFLVMGSMTFLSYGVKHQKQIWARVKSISVFHHNLPKEEIIKELWGSTKRTFGMFIFTGDPNPRQNPSGKTMFDWLTFGLMMIGLIILSKKQKSLFLISLFLSLPIFLNDILSVEFFPEFHYYGTGHPNTYRLSGLIPLVYFWVAYALDEIKRFLAKLKEKFYMIILIFIVFVIIVINWNWYFHQPISLFNYNVNGVKMLKVVNLINKSQVKKAYVSPSFIKDSRVKYFLKEGVILESFDPKTDEFSLSVIPVNQLTIIDPPANTKFSQSLLNQLKEISSQAQTKVMLNPWGEIDAFVVWHHK